MCARARKRFNNILLRKNFPKSNGFLLGTVVEESGDYLKKTNLV